VPYRHSDAARLIGVPATTLRNWSDAGFAPAFSGHEPGKSRRFSQRDILAARLMAEMSDAGVPFSDAAALAKAALAKLDDYCTATGSDDLAEDIKAVGLDKAVLLFWRAGDGGKWQTRIDYDGGLGEAFRAGRRPDDAPPLKYSVIDIHLLAYEIFIRICSLDVERLKKKGKRR
jgi:DNA-binding transcriptional MerR regulator